MTQLRTRVERIPEGMDDNGNRWYMVVSIDDRELSWPQPTRTAARHQAKLARRDPDRYTRVWGGLHAQKEATQ